MGAVLTGIAVGGVLLYLLMDRARAASYQAFEATIGMPQPDAPQAAPVAPWVPEWPGVFSFSDAGDSGSGANNAPGNVAAFLAMIRAAEGTADERGYSRIIGGQQFDSFADHPRVKVPFRETTGKLNYSTAAGAYQFLAATWDALAKRLNLPDFSPESQDAAAIELIRERGALRDVRAGNFAQAVAKVAAVWASLPGAPYPQRQRSPQFIAQAYETAGGRYA